MIYQKIRTLIRIWLHKMQKAWYPLFHERSLSIQRTTKWNITKPRRKEEEQSESQTIYVTKESWKQLYRHYDINPNVIRVGDIVEVQISFYGISLKGNRSKMAIILRAITLLDKRVHDVSNNVWPTLSPTNRV